MKNYVVWHNCHINDKERRFDIEPSASEEVRLAYDKMWQVSHASAVKFLAGEWEAVVFTEPAETRVKMFQDSWYRIWDLWHNERCNILCLDSDAMFIRPTEMFGKFSEFRMFNWSDPKSTHLYANNFNAGVRYYPSTMTDATWQIGADMAKNWNLDIWDQEQIIFNEMFWTQDIPESDRRHPELNWQGMQMIVPDPRMQAAHEEWNQWPISQTYIMHVHGSRNAVHTAQLMANVAQQLGINYTKETQ